MLHIIGLWLSPFLPHNGWKVKSALLISSPNLLSWWLACFPSGQCEAAAKARRRTGLGHPSEWATGDGQTAVVGGMMAAVNESGKKRKGQAGKKVSGWQKGFA